VHRTELVSQTEHSGFRAGGVSETGHVLNLDEPALFNETLERFLALAEADRWPPRDPASRRA
jgi:hypothetical protein